MTALLVITLLFWCAGWLVAGRLKKCPADRGAGAAASRLSVIIPARNEERNLPLLLRSLASSALQPREVIVVDDASNDRTAAVARQLGARVVNPQPLPAGWRGKTWACHQGALVAAGDWLLFLDADTWVEPDGLAQVLGGYAGGAFSVGPFHAVRAPYEDLSLFFNFSMTVGTVPDGLFGQMLLVDRASYRRIGGHEAVRERILENCFLAEHFRAAGIPVRSATGKNVLSFRMYQGGLRELVEGWTKGFAAGAGRTPCGVLLLVVAWMCGLVFAPVGALLTAGAWPWAGAYLLGAAQVGWLARRIGAFRWWTSLLYPVPLVFFFVVFARSSWRAGRQVNWKGRVINDR